MAYMCLSPAAGGVVTQSEVTNYVDCPAGSYIARAVSQFVEQPTLADVFNIPVSSDLKTMFLTGFSLPVICYLVAWGYQVVIGWFDQRDIDEQ